MNEFHSAREHRGPRDRAHRGRPGGQPPDRRYRWEAAEGRPDAGRPGAEGRDDVPGEGPGLDRAAERAGRRGRGAGRGRGGGYGPRGRAQRGDVRAAVLLLLQHEPMHGYQLMQAIAQRTDNAWRVSPGAVYPTISVLEDEGLVRVQAAGGRKLVTLTDSGHAYLADPATAPADPFEVKHDTTADSGLRGALDRVADAARTLERTGTSTQTDAARVVLDRARRELYLILADDPGAGSAGG